MTAAEKPLGRIKVRPDDFKVYEDGRAPVFESYVPPSLNTYLTKFLLTKYNVESARALREVANQLRIDERKISVQGRKDACALTTQLLVVEGAYHPSFTHDRIWLWKLGPTSRRLSFGGHSGNHFDIVVHADQAMVPVVPKRIMNTFGYQRFGSQSKEIGKYLLLGEFEQAAELLRGSFNWSKMQHIMREYQCSAAAAIQQPEFASDARFIMQQWQSHLFNQLAHETKEAVLPLWTLEDNVHWQYWHLWDPREVDDSMYTLLHRPGKRPVMRPVYVDVGRHTLTACAEGWRHQFTLPAGAFATVFLGEMYDLRDDSVERREQGLGIAAQ